VDDVDLVVQFDPPNDHKDYLHRSGRTARAGASGMVIALVERGQLRELRRLHDAAGVTAASDEVAAGHHVVRQIAASGTPVPPAPERPARERPASERKPAARGHSRRRGNGPRRAGSATGERAGSASRTGSSNHAGGSSRTARIAAGGREDAGRGTARGATRGAAQGTANPGRRSQSAHRPHQARGNQYTAKSA
jgi:superfamily II DNA/RNA helicase